MTMNVRSLPASGVIPAESDHRAWLDRLGMSAGLVCAVPCLTLPVIVALIPVARLELLLGEGVEWAFVIIALAVGAVSLVPGFFRLHRRVMLLFLLGLGASLLLAGRTLVGEEGGLELPVVVAGALAVVLAHAVNARFCTVCRSCETWR